MAVGMISHEECRSKVIQEADRTGPSQTKWIIQQQSEAFGLGVLKSGLPLRPSIPSQVAAAEVSPKENFDHRRRTTAMAASIPFTEVLTLLLFLVVLFQSPPAASSLDSYEALQEFNFPQGPPPKGRHRLRAGPGQRQVSRLPRRFLQLLHILFLWMNIVEVTRVSDLEFSVGIASASYDIDNFFESTQCGCGFDCGIEVRTNLSSSVSSI
ncbi:hypothetical protein SAY86_022596 [Trapa natans]|uniref:Uncharacterized protein n=1 Tax=Trapa natans TaxID=22666 RepID=A0AAN7LT87_TRANT|nr:hypothetical protein SAY86_022596 [Trapa natans]